MVRWRIVWLNLNGWFRWWFAPAVIGLFLFLGWQSAAQLVALARNASLKDAPNVWDGFVVAFLGPDAWSAALSAMLLWFVAQLVFFYLIGDLANGELTRRGYITVPLNGTRLRWGLNQLATLFFIALGYAAIGMVSVWLGAASQLPTQWQMGAFLKSGAQLDISNRMSELEFVLLVFALFATSLMAMGTLQWTLSILWRRSIYGLTAISLIAIFSWLAGIGQPTLLRWLPGSQSMLLRHTFFDARVPDFSWQWSVLYNVMLTIGAGAGGCWIIRRMDILAKSFLHED